MKKIKEENNIAEKPKKKGGWSLAVDILSWTLIGGMFVYTTINVIDIKSGYKLSFFGTRNSVIVSESMSFINEANKEELAPLNIQTIQKFDLVQTREYKKYEDIKKYDVLTYVGQSGELICHRVIDLYTTEEGQFIVTRGDANTGNDTPFKYERVKGKVVHVIPKVGHAVNFVKSPYLYIALFGSGFFYFLGRFIYTYGDKNEKKELATEAPQEENK